MRSIGSLGLKKMCRMVYSRRRFADKYLKPLLEAEEFVMTISDKPNSSKQMYVISRKHKKYNKY